MKWKWSDGSKSDKTVRDKEMNRYMRLENESFHNSSNARSIALNHDETTWDLMTNIQMSEHRKDKHKIQHK